MGVDPSELLTYFICMKLNSKEDFSLEKEGFLQGMADLGCTTMADLKKIVPNLR